MAKGFVLRLGDQVGALCLNLENIVSKSREHGSLHRGQWQKERRLVNISDLKEAQWSPGRAGHLDEWEN